MGTTCSLIHYWIRELGFILVWFPECQNIWSIIIHITNYYLNNTTLIFKYSMHIFWFVRKYYHIWIICFTYILHISTFDIHATYMPNTCGIYVTYMWHIYVTAICNICVMLVRGCTSYKSIRSACVCSSRRQVLPYSSRPLDRYVRAAIPHSIQHSLSRPSEWPVSYYSPLDN